MCDNNSEADFLKKNYIFHEVALHSSEESLMVRNGSHLQNIRNDFVK